MILRISGDGVREVNWACLVVKVQEMWICDYRYMYSRVSTKLTSTGLVRSIGCACEK